MSEQDLSKLVVVIPNLHWHYSGVTATNRIVAPWVERGGEEKPFSGQEIIRCWVASTSRGTQFPMISELRELPKEYVSGAETSYDAKL